MQVKHALEQFRLMQLQTGKQYEKEIDFLLDRMIALDTYEIKIYKILKRNGI